MLRMVLDKRIDVVSTYPKLQDMLNIDKFTTQTELSAVDGMEEEQWRWVGIDLTGGVTNGTMIAQELLGLPTSKELLDYYDKVHAAVGGMPITQTSPHQDFRPSA